MIETQEPFAQPIFICDDMLGKLARALRKIGYFARYFRSIEDKKLVWLAAENDWVLLTRDTLILPRRGLGRHLLIKSDHWDEQLGQVIKDIRLQIEPDRFYTICLECNQRLEMVDKEIVRGLVPPYVYHQKERFSQCLQCDRIYWRATHWDHMDKTIRKVLKLKGSFT